MAPQESPGNMRSRVLTTSPMSVAAASSRSPQSDGERDVEFLRDPLKQRHRPGRFLLRQQVDLEVEVRPALAQPREGVLADQDEEREKDGLQGDDQREETKGDGSMDRQPGTSPVFQAIHAANQTTWTPANHPVPAIRAMTFEKRAAAVCPARSAASSWATASTFRARSVEAGPRSITSVPWRRNWGMRQAQAGSRPAPARCVLVPGARSRVSASLRAFLGSDRRGGRSRLAFGPSGMP
jgi:hypothetical protein